ncbi:MAG: glycosyltransferase family 4 protein [Phycisphaerae bacterium]|nr:glycosyltransferase family 4 protein [Phycisphaerae bacterium]
MRIAFLTSEYVTEASFAGGLAQYLGRVTSGLVARGHDVEVFVIAESCETVEHQGVIVRRVPAKKWLPLRIANIACKAMHRRRLCKSQLACSTALGLYHAFRQRASAARFDIVQAASWLGTGYFAAKNPWTPVVVRASSFEPVLFPHRGQSLSLDETIYCRFETAAMRRAAAVYTPSRFLAGEIRKATGVQPHVVNPPFCAALGRAREDVGAHDGRSDYVMYFGKVAKYKGSGLLAEAIEPLLTQTEQLHLVIAGPSEDDPEAQRLLSLAERFPASVRYVGSRDHDTVMRLVGGARVVVLPSLMDNLPNTCLEAMAMGKVVVGPNGVSFDELITDGQSGILFQTGNPLSLRQGILQAWHMTEDRRRAMGRAACMRIDQMAPETALRDLECFYEGVIENHAQSGGTRRPVGRVAKECSLR